MENEKCSLKIRDKIILVIVAILFVGAIISWYLDFFEALDIAAPIAWMLLCAANILTNCAKWENHTKFNVILTCLFGAGFLINAVSLILTLVA